MPPTPLKTQILLALTKGEAHGAAIMRQMIEDSQAVFIVENNILYPALKRLCAEDLVERRRIGRLAQVLHSRVLMD